jgi:hypothetical protein
VAQQQEVGSRNGGAGQWPVGERAGEIQIHAKAVRPIGTTSVKCPSIA